MEQKNSIQITVFFIFLLLVGSSSLQGLKNLSIFDCDGNRIKPKDNALAWDINRATEEAVEQAKTCLPSNFYQDIKKDLDNRELKIYVDCGMKKGCAKTIQKKKNGKRVGLWIDLSYENIYIEGACGCVESKILHELLHWGAGLTDSPKDEKKAYGCEKKCFEECAKVPEGTKIEDCCVD